MVYKVLHYLPLSTSSFCPDPFFPYHSSATMIFNASKMSSYFLPQGLCVCREAHSLSLLIYTHIHVFHFKPWLKFLSNFSDFSRLGESTCHNSHCTVHFLISPCLNSEKLKLLCMFLCIICLYCTIRFDMSWFLFSMFITILSATTRGPGT